MPSRLGALAALAGLCLALAGCGGGKISKANADKVNTGMTEKEVSDLLGAPTETAEVAVPDMGGLLGGGAGVPGMPKKARQSIWKEGDKVIVVTFVDGKVSMKTTNGF
jgi:hypothetical protein